MRMCLGRIKLTKNQDNLARTNFDHGVLVVNKNQPKERKKLCLIFFFTNECVCGFYSVKFQHLTLLALPLYKCF